MAFLDVNSFDSQSITLPLLLDESGFVSESSGACVFMVKGNKILTPRKGYILESITRDFVLSKIASKLPQLQFNETCITRWDLYSADEIFIVGTNVEIQESSI